MLKIAIIEESRANRKKIVSQFQVKGNVEIFSAVANLQNFSDSLLMNSPLVPNVVLFSTLMGTTIRDEMATRIQKLCPGCVIINYGIVNNGETLIISAGKGNIPNGGHFFAFNTLELLVELSQRNCADAMHKDQETTSNRGQNLLEKKITLREMEVISGLSSGLTYDEIATKMSLSINTVRRYVKNIYNKLSVRNKVQLINKFTYRNTQPEQSVSSSIHSTKTIMA